MITYSIKRIALFGLFFILIIACFTRIADGAALTYFRYDQGRLSLMALEMANGDAFHWLGPPNSGGLPTSPLIVWFYSLLFLLSDSPQFVTFAVALWNVVGIIFLWWIGSRYFGSIVGFVAGLALAANPWAIHYSRAIWEPRVMIPFLLIAISLGLYGYIENKRWAQSLFLPMLLVALQFHYIAFFLFPIYFVILWIGRQNFQRQSFFLSIFLALIVVLPFIYGMITQEQTESRMFKQIIEILQAGPELRFYPIQQLLDLSSGANISGLLRNHANIFFLEFAPYSDLVSQGVTALIALGLMLTWLPSWRKYALLLYTWAFLTLLIQIPAWTGRGVFLHYHLVALPAYPLLIGIGVEGIIQILHKQTALYRFARYFILLLVVIIFSLQGFWMWRLYQFSDTNYSYSPDSGQTTTPLHYLMDVREALQPYDDVMILGANPHESNYYVWEPMLYNSASCVRDLLINGGGIDVLPNHPYAVLVAPLSPINTDYVVPDRYQHETPQIIPMRSGEDPYIIYSFDEAPEWTETPIIPIEPVSFVTGIQLTGYYLVDGWMQLRWKVQELTDESFQYFGHFIDAEGEKIGQRDAPFYVGQHWCAGDTLITTIDINLPLDTNRLRIGLYTLDKDGGITGLSTIDSDAQSGALWLDILLNDDSE